jgi:hypothetical protein
MEENLVKMEKMGKMEEILEILEKIIVTIQRIMGHLRRSSACGW